MRLATTLLATIALAATTACASYYKVSDPATGQDYYTKKYKQRKSGSVVFTDEKTGRQVTLQNSEIEEVSKGTYRSGLAN